MRVRATEHPARDPIHVLERIHGLAEIVERGAVPVESLRVSHTSPVARRVLGENNELTLKVRWVYASVLCDDPAATLDDLREAVSTLEETARTARRVLGISHPVTEGIEDELKIAREDLRARETPSASP